MATEKQTNDNDDNPGFEAAAEDGLLHLVHGAGEDFIDPERIVNIGEALVEQEDGGEPMLTVYLIIEGADEQLDVPGLDLGEVVAAWVKLRKSRG